MECVCVKERESMCMHTYIIDQCQDLLFVVQFFISTDSRKSVTNQFAYTWNFVVVTYFFGITIRFVETPLRIR